MKKEKTKTIKPIRPSAAIRIEYQKKLDKLIKQMADSTQYWVKSFYNKNEPAVIAADASPIKDFMIEFNRVAKRWIVKFSKISLELAKINAEKILKQSDNAFKNKLKEAGFTVKFSMTREQQDAMAAIIEENVNLIKSIPQKYFTDVKTVVNTGWSMGRNSSYIYDNIKEKYKLTKNKAALIARDQCNKATASFNRNRQIELGFNQARWLHSSAGKTPRPDHVAANGKIYDVRKGCLISGEYILPGQKINCRCISETLLPY